MEEPEVKSLISKELLSFEENYVPDKIYWQRTVKMILIISSLLMSLVGGMVAWGFKISTEVTNNTQARNDIDRRLENIEADNKKILENYNDVAGNQKEILMYHQKLSKKMDALIDKAGARYSD